MRRIFVYGAVAACAILVAAAILVGTASLANHLVCRVIPICESKPSRSKPNHEIRWTGRAQDSPNLRLNIPREYITFYVEPKKGEETEFVTLSIHLPDLKPRSGHFLQRCEGTSDIACESLVDRANLLSVRLRSDSSIGAHQPSARIGTADWRTIYPRFRRESDKMGFQHYVEHGGSGTCVRRDIVEGDSTVRRELLQIAATHAGKYVCWPAGDELFVSVGDASRPDTVIRCGALFESAAFGNNCVAEINFNSWRVEYMFAGSELKRWREFDAGARELLRRLASPR